MWVTHRGTQQVGTAIAYILYDRHDTPREAFTAWSRTLEEHEEEMKRKKEKEEAARRDFAPPPWML
jgi:hypothetical protein